MKIGLFFGSFNPIHTGHLIIAEEILNQTDLEQIWIMVTPQSPFKKQGALLDENNRFYLAQLATEDNPRLYASNFEFDLPRPSYTVNTLTELVAQYPQHEFALIMGADNLQTLEKWKKSEVIIEHYPIYYYPRRGVTPDPPFSATIRKTEAPIIELSATRIRELVRTGQSVRYLLPEAVRQEVLRAGFFQD
jgi:nicotinate-nucleotide adenylyltransferase